MIGKIKQKSSHTIFFKKTLILFFFNFVPLILNLFLNNRIGFVFVKASIDSFFKKIKELLFFLSIDLDSLIFNLFQIIKSNYYS